MKRELPTVVLLVTHGFIAAITLAFYLRVRPFMLEVLRDEHTLTPLTALLLSRWFLPTALAASAVLAATAFFRKRRERLRWLAFAVGGACIAFILTVVLTYLPLLNAAQRLL